MANTTIHLEGFGAGWRIEIDGPLAPREPIKAQTDSEAVDLIEEHMARLRAVPPRVIPEPQPTEPPNLCPPITRRSRTWAAKKQETSDNA